MDHAPTKKLVPTSDDSPQLILEDYNIDLEESKKSSREFEKKSKILSLGIAMITHVILFIVLYLIVIVNFREQEIEMVVEAGSDNVSQIIKKQSFAKKVTNKKPAPPSNPIAPIITATNSSSVTLPEIIDPTDSLAFGNGFGDGFGIGGFGDGSGGAKFFGTSGGGNRIILVIDTSTSMNNNCGAEGIAALRREIVKTLSSLSPNVRFNIICFGQDCDGFSSQPVVANANNIANAKNWMKAYFINKKGGAPFDRTRTSQWGAKGKDNNGISYFPIMPSTVKVLEGTSGGSRMDLALVAAFLQKPSSVFLIADGEPGTAKGGQKLGNTAIVDLIFQESKKIYRGQLPKVNCISVKGIGEAILKDISKRFRGNYKAVDPSKV